MSKLNNVQILEKIQKTQMSNDITNFKVGDTICVTLKIEEGKKSRLQNFTGVVLKIRGRNTSKTFILRKECPSESNAELTFYLHSPQIVKISVVRRGKVRRAYISYMRQRSGKSARIKQF